MRKSISVCSLLLFLLSCDTTSTIDGSSSDPWGDNWKSAITGEYEMVLFGGQSLPAIVAESDEGKREILTGTLEVTPQSFSWWSFQRGTTYATNEVIERDVIPITWVWDPDEWGTARPDSVKTWHPDHGWEFWAVLHANGDVELLSYEFHQAVYRKK